MPARIQRPIDLNAALRGESAALDAKDAVYLLARSGEPGVQDRLSSLIRNGRTMPIRRRAALALSLMPNAHLALREAAAAVEEPKVLAGVLLSLARVGVEEDLPVIRAAATRLSGHEADQARFAALLLAHRFRLGRDVVPPAETPVARDEPANAKPIVLGTAQEGSLAWRRFVPNASLGFEPDVGRCIAIHCGRRVMAFIPAVEVWSGGARLEMERIVVGATVAYEREHGTWHHDLWILSTPSADVIELQAWTQGGRPIYAGAANLSGGGVSFELRTTQASRVALVHVHGGLTAEGLTVEGLVGDRDPSDSRAPALRPRPQ